MSAAVVTGSAGLIGAGMVEQLAAKGYDVVGIDNDMRAEFFGERGSTAWNRRRLERKLGAGYRHHDIDIRAGEAVDSLFRSLGPAIQLVVHTAAQPAHDWAAQNPRVDFAVNAVGTLNVLEATRLFSPQAHFIFTSSSKVYGDHPNRLAFDELELRWEAPRDSAYYKGINEGMSIDGSMKSLLGSSKAAADLLVQEYGRYFGLQTTSVRGNCLTGPGHSPVERHGFLAYLMWCAVTRTEYRIYGYKGKQVRDNVHSTDFARALEELASKPPPPGEVFNIGGGRFSNCSILEALAMAAEIVGEPVRTSYVPTARRADHIWYVTDTAKFQDRYPSWRQTYDTRAILTDIYETNCERWRREVGSRPEVSDVRR